MALTIEPDEEPTIEPDPSIVNDEPQGSRICLGCGKSIPDYLSGGNRRKYHEECRPSKTQVKSTGNGGRTTSVDTLIGQMTELYAGLGAALSFAPATTKDGFAVAGNATTLAESWRPLIMKDPKIRKMWEKITTGSGWGAVILSHGMVAMAIASNHGVTLPGIRQDAPQETGL